MQIVFILLVSLSYFIKSISCEIFAENINEETFFQNNLTTIHTCRNGFSVCLKFTINYSFVDSKHFKYHRSPFCIACSIIQRKKSTGYMSHFYKTTLPLTVPSRFLCNPSYWNKSPLFIQSLKLALYLKWTDLEDDYFDEYTKNNYVEYDLSVPEPFEREKCNKFNDRCTNFGHNISNILFDRNLHKIQSPLMKAPYIIASEPFLSRSKIGLFLPTFQTEASSEYTYFLQKNKNKFTISFWMYIHEKCTAEFCSILSFFSTLKDKFASPVLLLMPSGDIHVQGLLKNPNQENHQAFLAGFKVPVRQWNRIIFKMNHEEWSLAIFDKDNDRIASTKPVKFSSPIDIDLLRYVGVLGGSRLYHGLTGFFSDVVIWPGRLLTYDMAAEASTTTSFQMFTPYLKTWWSDDGHCHQLWEEVSLYRLVWNLKKENQKQICRSNFLFDQIDYPQCIPKISDMKRPSIYKKVVSILEKAKTINDDSLWEWPEYRKSAMLWNLGDFMSSRIWDHLKNRGVKWSKLTEKYLADSFCLGKADSGYLLATGYYYGIGKLEMNLIRSVSVFLTNTLLFNDRLSFTALGNIYLSQFGNSHSPVVSSVFYEMAANFARIDIEDFDANDMFADQIRLSDDESLREHTDEDGDLMQWIQHQASAGEYWAKERLGRIFYWGSQGIRRNLQQAIHFMREAAQAPDAEPVHHFDYGLTLIQKTDKTEDEIEEGRKELEKAAAKNEPRAFTALGWLYETKYHDYKKAIEYYKKGADAGNPDALFNIGVYYHNGVKGVMNKNKVEAFKCFQRAAAKGQINAGYLFAQYILTGIDGYLGRNMTLSIKWFKHVAEKSPKLGLYLSEGVRAFRKKQISLSFLYYLLSAMTGIELSSYNAAILCEEYPTMAKHHIKKECIWYHYNQSVLREPHAIYGMSLIKMGDMHWYGCLENTTNVQTAIEYYIRATQKHEPRAYYNLGYILEKNYTALNATQLQSLRNIYDDYIEEEDENGIDLIQTKLKSTKLALAMYSRCESLTQDNEHLACSIAKWRIELKIGWEKYSSVIKLISALLMLCPVLVYIAHIQRRTNNEVPSSPGEPIITPDIDIEQGTTSTQSDTEKPVAEESDNLENKEDMNIFHRANGDVVSNSVEDNTNNSD